MKLHISFFCSEEPEKVVEKCSLCHNFPKECACVECGAQTCKKCSKAIPSGKVSILNKLLSTKLMYFICIMFLF